MKLKIIFFAFIFSIFAILSFPLNTWAKTANTGYFNEYKTISTFSNSTYSAMQGMCVDSSNNMAYSIKIKPNESGAILYRTDLNKKKVITMKNNGNNIVSGLYHANDMEIVTIDGIKYLYIVTCSDKTIYEVVKLKISGTSYTKIATYHVVNHNKKEVSVSGISLISQSGNNIQFMFKKGATIYQSTVGKNLKTKSTILLSKPCTLNLKTSKINGKVISNIDNYISQGFTYYKKKVFAPYTYKNISVIFVFGIDGNTTLPSKVTSVSNLSFRITSGTYKDFEIESCDIGKNGRLYFNYNATGNQDKIAYFGRKFNTRTATIYQFN